MYKVKKSGTLMLTESINEQFDENGNATYTVKKENETKTISEEEYYDIFEKYSNATVVSFAYGASTQQDNSFTNDLQIITLSFLLVRKPKYTALRGVWVCVLMIVFCVFRFTTMFPVCFAESLEMHDFSCT